MGVSETTVAAIDIWHPRVSKTLYGEEVVELRFEHHEAKDLAFPAVAKLQVHGTGLGGNPNRSLHHRFRRIPDVSGGDGDDPLSPNRDDHRAPHRLLRRHRLLSMVFLKNDYPAKTLKAVTRNTRSPVRSMTSRGSVPSTSPSSKIAPEIALSLHFVFRLPYAATLIDLD